MKGDQVPPELDVDNEVQVSTTSLTFKHLESIIESKQQEASILEESTTMKEDPKLNEVKIVDMPIPLIYILLKGEA